MRLKLRYEPSEHRRLPRPAPKRVIVTDGPFAETKELVLGSKEEDFRWEEER